MNKVMNFTVVFVLFSGLSYLTEIAHGTSGTDICVLPETGFSSLNVLVVSLVAINLIVYRVLTNKLNENK